MSTDQGIPKGVITLENALSYIEAIGEAVKRCVMDLDKEDRSEVVGIVSAVLSQTSESLQQFRAKLEQSGEATPVTEEQKLRLRKIMKDAKTLN